jgi:hypothetical protein
MSVPVNKALYERVKKKVYALYDKPSAYRSGALVQEYKRQGGTYEKKTNEKPLQRWFQEEWKNVAPKGKYPVLRPTKRISYKTPTTLSEIPKKRIQEQVKLKQKIKEKNLPKF